MEGQYDGNCSLGNITLEIIAFFRKEGKGKKESTKLRQIMTVHKEGC